MFSSISAGATPCIASMCAAICARDEPPRCFISRMASTTWWTQPAVAALLRRRRAGCERRTERRARLSVGCSSLRSGCGGADTVGARPLPRSAAPMPPPGRGPPIIIMAGLKLSCAPRAATPSDFLGDRFGLVGEGEAAGGGCCWLTLRSASTLARLARSASFLTLEGTSWWLPESVRPNSLARFCISR